MLKLLMLSALTAVLNFAAMSQTTPPANVECLDREELRILVETNEQGRRARAQNRVYRDKIKTLEENNSLLRDAVKSKDSTIADRNTQVSSLTLAYGNGLTVIQGKDAIIADVNAKLQTALKQVRQQRRQKVFVIITGIVATGASIYLLR